DGRGRAAEYVEELVRHDHGRGGNEEVDAVAVLRIHLTLDRRLELLGAVVEAELFPLLHEPNGPPRDAGGADLARLVEDAVGLEFRRLERRGAVVDGVPTLVALLP